MSGKRMVQRNSLTIFTSKMDVPLSLLLFMTHGKILKVNISAKRFKELNLYNMKDKTAYIVDVILLLQVKHYAHSLLLRPLHLQHFSGFTVSHAL